MAAAAHAFTLTIGAVELMMGPSPSPHVLAWPRYELIAGEPAQPDLFLIRAHSRGPHEHAGSWAGIASLLLAVEVISPSTGRQDRVTKRDFYLGADVAEYWVVDLDARLVERWTPDRATPRVERAPFAWRAAGSAEPLRVDVPGLFERIKRKLGLIAKAKTRA